MRKRVICECTDQQCKCQGKCVAEAKTVVITKDQKEVSAVCHGCGSDAVSRGGHNYSTHAEQQILQRVG